MRRRTRRFGRGRRGAGGAGWAHTGEGARRGTGSSAKGGAAVTGERLGGQPTATKLRIEVQNPTKSCITRFMHETWRNRERGAFAGDTPPPTSAFSLEPTRRTGTSRPAWTTTAGEDTRVAGCRTTPDIGANAAPGAPTLRHPAPRPAWTLRRDGSVSAHRSGRQARSQPRRGRPANRSRAPASRAGTRPPWTPDTQRLRAPDIRPGPQRSPDARARAHVPQSSEPLPRRHSHIADNAHYVK